MAVHSDYQFTTHLPLKPPFYLHVRMLPLSMACEKVASLFPVFWLFLVHLYYLASHIQYVSGMPYSVSSCFKKPNTLNLNGKNMRDHKFYPNHLTFHCRVLKKRLCM